LAAEPRVVDVPTDHRATAAGTGSRAAALVIALLAACTLAATVLADARDQRERQEDQAVIAQRAEATLAGEVRTTLARLQDLAAVAEATPDLDDGAFQRRARRVLAERGLRSIELVAVVPAAERAAFERRFGRIRQPDAGRRAFVVVRTAGPTTTRDPVGTDLAADPLRRQALEAAALVGDARATPPVALVPPSVRGVALFAPAGDQVVAATLASTTLAQALRRVLPADAAVRVLDGGRAVARLGGRPAEASTLQLVAGGRSWVVEVGRRDLGLGTAPVIALLGSLLTLLLGALAVQAARRERYALELVDQRMAERDRSDARREAAERHFADAFEDAPIGMQIVGADGRIERVNQAMVHITGYPREQLQGMVAAELLHPDDRARDAEEAERLATGDQRVIAGDRRCLHALGDIVWVHVSATLLRGAGGDEPKTLVQVQDITERRRYEAQLQYLADHDPLTGLLNRRAFEREVHRHLRHGERYGAEGAVLVLDIDDFKSVNDTLGHSAGDELIIDVAGALRDRLRESDVLARLGGDEFAVLLPQVDPEGAKLVADDLVRTVREVRVRRPDGRQRSVTTSIGVAPILTIETSTTVDDLLVMADVAMYEAKEAGSDRAAVHRAEEAGEEPRVMARLTWADRIRTALEEDRFVLHAQPIVDLGSGEACQHELLLRMVDEDGEVVPPGVFLHVAERVDLMPEIDRWVVQHAIELIAERRALGEDLVLEVNLSGRSTGDPEILRLIEEGLREHQVDASRLIFEVTETVAISNIPRAQHFASRLAELGCRFALDDFGAGFGSFYYLKHLPFDVLKIDGEFVRHCTQSPTDQVLIKAVVDIARGLGKRTVAEHVGDDETVALLRELGVDLGQGFHLGRPAPLPAADRLAS
jgi:diguanylate cyclase (GGDEF)-like protein/PAS domain S-box-containing protein